MVMKMSFQMWSNIHDHDKMRNLFERCQELEQTVAEQQAQIRNLLDRLQRCERAVGGTS
jgi:hypothetical protein